MNRYLYNGMVYSRGSLFHALQEEGVINKVTAYEYEGKLYTNVDKILSKVATKVDRQKSSYVFYLQKWDLTTDQAIGELEKFIEASSYDYPMELDDMSVREALRRQKSLSHRETQDGRSIGFRVRVFEKKPGRKWEEL